MRRIALIIIGFLTLSFVNAQTLDDYLRIAKQNSSEISSQNFELQIAKEKVNEVGNLGDTNMSFGYFVSTPETRVGAQTTKLGIQQQLPWFGTLSAQKDLANSIAETKHFDIDLTQRDLFYQVKSVYFELYNNEAITSILKENKQILSTYENMALAALENNKATMSDVLNIRIQKNELHSKIFQNLNEINALSRIFNRILQRDAEIPLVITDNLNVLDILVPEASVNGHPSLEKIEHLNTIYEKENALIHKERQPSLAFGVDYILVEERNDLKLTDNGKDILMPKIALSIPLFNKKHSSKLHQIQIKKEALASQREVKQKQLEIALEKSYLDINNEILRVVAAQKNKEETQRAINVDLKAYETGILDYDKILKLQIQKIKYQLMEIEATKNAYIAKAKTVYLTQSGLKDIIVTNKKN